MGPKEANERNLPPFTMLVFKRKIRLILEATDQIKDEFQLTRSLDGAKIDNALELIEELKDDVQGYRGDFTKGKFIEKITLIGKKEIFKLEKYFRYLKLILIDQMRKEVTSLIGFPGRRPKRIGGSLKNRPEHIAAKKKSDKAKKKKKKTNKMNDRSRGKTKDTGSRSSHQNRRGSH
ncbi:MAG: hypothetical protein ABIH35_04770 [Patescibacteria group bacterium]